MRGIRLLDPAQLLQKLIEVVVGSHDFEGDPGGIRPRTCGEACSTKGAIDPFSDLFSRCTGDGDTEIMHGIPRTCFS
jgi:hypothetical protein